jgi:hypothetical protein
MTKQVQRRRGTTAQHTGFTGAEGEITVNTTNKSAVVHDGATAGGVEAARADLVNVDGADIASTISGETVASLTVTSADINGGTIDGTTVGASTPSSGAFTTLTTTGGATIGGDLTVNGTTTTINSTTLTVDDINITLASGAADAAAANGAGITVDGASATFNYASTGDKWTMNKPLDVTGNIIVSGTVDGRDIATDGTKLDGIAANAIANVVEDTTPQLGGNLDTNGNDINFGDNDKVIFGAGDLQIYHDATGADGVNGAGSYIEESGAGNLWIMGSQFVSIEKADGTNRVLQADTTNGDIELKYQDATKLTTTSSGIDVTGTVTADGLQIDGDSTFEASSSSTTITKDWASLGGAALRLHNSDSTTNNFEGIVFTSRGSTSDADQAGSGIFSVNTSRGGVYPTADLDFYTTNGAGSFQKRMSLDSGGDISFYDSTGVTQGLYWDASTQRLGLGTTSPSTSLHVQSGTQFDGIRLSKANGNRVVEINGLDSDNDEGNITLRLADTAKVQMRADGNSYFNGGSVGIGTASPTKTLTVHGSDGTPLLLQGSGIDTAIAFAHSGTTNAAINSSSDGAIEFRAGGAGAADEAMRITSGGNVGIGTSSPNQSLHVLGEGLFEKTSADSVVSVNSTGGSGRSYQIRSQTSGDFYIYDNTAGSARLTIDSSGNVGIGTSSPQYKLAVSNNGGNGLEVRPDFSGDTETRINSYNRSGGSYTTLSFDTGVVKFRQFGTTDAVTIDSSGNVLVGKTDTSTASQGCVLGAGGLTSFNRDNDVVVRVRRDGTDGDAIEFYNDASKVGSISVTGSSTAYNTSSDYRLKENVAEVTGASDRVKALNPVRFNFIADPDKTVDGFLAHEVQNVVPEAISGTKDAMRDEEYEVTPAVLDEDGNVVTEAVMGTRSVPDYQGIDQSKLVPLLTAALQEALTKIDDLETRIAALEAN